MPSPIFDLLQYLLDLYWFVVMAAVIMSWLIAFNVVNYRHDFVRQIVRFLDAATEPVFRQVRRVIPPIGGLDLSPVVVLIAIWFLEKCLDWARARYGF